MQRLFLLISASVLSLELREVASGFSQTQVVLKSLGLGYLQ